MNVLYFDTEKILDRWGYIHSESHLLYQISEYIYSI